MRGLCQELALWLGPWSATQNKTEQSYLVHQKASELLEVNISQVFWLPHLVTIKMYTKEDPLRGIPERSGQLRHSLKHPACSSAFSVTQVWENLHLQNSWPRFYLVRGQACVQNSDLFGSHSTSNDIRSTSSIHRNACLSTWDASCIRIQHKQVNQAMGHAKNLYNIYRQKRCCSKTLGRAPCFKDSKRFKQKQEIWLHKRWPCFFQKETKSEVFNLNAPGLFRASHGRQPAIQQG